MENKEIVERLAKRLGWSVKTFNDRSIATVDKNNQFTSHFNPPDRHPFLTSLGALRPVLATLTEIERAAVDETLRREYGEANINTVTSVDGLRWFLLTLDPAILARAVAEAIGGDK